jgi:hypothetical protein
MRIAYLIVADVMEVLVFAAGAAAMIYAVSVAL